MPVQISCPHCRTLTAVPEAYVGQNVRCGGCQQVFLAQPPAPPQPVPVPVPVPSSAPAPMPPSPPAPVPYSPPPHSQHPPAVAIPGEAENEVSEWSGLSENLGYLEDYSSIPGAYRHVNCGQTTSADQNVVYRMITDPYFSMSTSAVCAGCGNRVPRRELVWNKTQENVAEFAKRMKSAMPAGLKLFRLLIGPLLVGVGGATLVFLGGGGIIVAIITLLVGALIVGLVLGLTSGVVFGSLMAGLAITALLMPRDMERMFIAMIALSVGTIGGWIISGVLVQAVRDPRQVYKQAEKLRRQSQGQIAQPG